MEITESSLSGNERSDLKRFVTLPEASRQTGIGLRQFRRAVESGRLQVFDIGSWPRLRWNDVLAWIEGTRRTVRDCPGPDQHGTTEKGQ